VAKATPAGTIVEYDNAGGSPVDITQHVLTVNDVDIESLTEETHSLGDSWEENIPYGVARVGTVELGGLYDDVATTGPDALFANRAPETPSSATRTLKFTWRSGKTTSVETFLAKYTRSVDRNGLTKYKATLQPTGAVTEV
jgi:hypothetical protein